MQILAVFLLWGTCNFLLELLDAFASVVLSSLNQCADKLIAKEAFVKAMRKWLMRFSSLRYWLPAQGISWNQIQYLHMYVLNKLCTLSSLVWFALWTLQRLFYVVNRFNSFNPDPIKVMITYVFAVPPPASSHCISSHPSVHWHFGEWLSLPYISVYMTFPSLPLVVLMTSN